MSEIAAQKYRNKYRVTSTRLQSWDYRWNAAYFVTICTKNRECFFGDIVNGGIELSPIGKIADILWSEIKNHEKNIELGEFVVMPNHVHGILVLNGNDSNITDNGDDVCVENDDDEYDVETLHATSLRSRSSSQLKNKTMASISPKPGSVSTIIRSYKSAVTKHSHRLGYEFIWQNRFHDHIIRNRKSYQNIANYIINNPVKWDNDTLNPLNNKSVKIAMFQKDGIMNILILPEKAGMIY